METFFVLAINYARNFHLNLENRDWLKTTSYLSSVGFRTYLPQPFMWLGTELQKLQLNSLSIRQQLEIIQDNEYIRCNLSRLFNISIQIRDVDKNTNPSDALSKKISKEVNLVWTNILSYLKLLFPIVWKDIGRSNVLQEFFSDKVFSFNTRDINLRIQSCKKVIEVSRTLVYGGSLRLPFSQDIYTQNLHKFLLISCQKSDVSGEKIIAGQNRILFLQSWLGKLISGHSLFNYLNNHTKFLSPARPLKRKSAQVSDTKYTISKIPILNHKIVENPVVGTSPTTSSDSGNTSFSAYLNRDKFKTPQFVGLRIKFDSDHSDSSYSSKDSQNSIWNPVFKKKKQK